MAKAKFHRFYAAIFAEAMQCAEKGVEADAAWKAQKAKKQEAHHPLFLQGDVLPGLAFGAVECQRACESVWLEQNDGL